MVFAFLQAQLVDLRSELTEAKAERAVAEREVHDLLLQLHALQLQLRAQQGQTEDSDTIKDRLVGWMIRRSSTNLSTNVSIPFSNSLHFLKFDGKILYCGDIPNSIDSIQLNFFM